MNNKNPQPKQHQDLTITRVFNAPCALVFQAWIDPTHLARWWGPEGFTCPRADIDARPGGHFLVDMRAPDGTVIKGGGIFEEIDEPNRLVLTTHAFQDQAGNPLVRVRNTLTFRGEGNQTTLTLHATVLHCAPEGEAAVAGMAEGWSQSLAKLQVYVVTSPKGETSMSNSTQVTLPSDREISMSRVFNAPRELVFRAHIEPEMTAQWWGQRSTTTVVDKLDARPGGSWRFVQHAEDGNEYAFHGEFREVTPYERIVQTFEFEGMPGKILVETLSLEDLGGKTRLTTTSVFESKEDRDGMLYTGMEAGANESWDRLDELLARQTA